MVLLYANILKYPIGGLDNELPFELCYIAKNVIIP
jgi:hypothetical protein